MLLCNSIAISITDLYQKKISLLSIIFTFIICMIFQAQKSDIHLLAILSMNLFNYFIRNFLKKGDLALLLAISVNMTFVRLSHFYFFISILSFSSYLISKIYFFERLPFAPVILISHFIIIHI